MTYDSVGRIATLTDYDGFTWAFDYWGSTWTDRLKTITFPDQTQASLTYTGLANRVITTVTGQNGAIHKSVHDVADSPSLMATIDPFSKIAVFAFDSNKRLHSYKDELNHEWTYGYDASGNLTTITDPELRVTNYGYDALDRTTEFECDGATTYVLYEDPDHERSPSSLVEPPDDRSLSATSMLEYFGPLDGSPQGVWNGARAR